MTSRHLYRAKPPIAVKPHRIFAAVGLAVGVTFAGHIQAAPARAASPVKNIYSFTGGINGSGPGSLLYQGGLFYGVTQFGGAGTACVSGCGTVFSFDPVAKKQTVLYSFLGGSDGAFPVGNLVYQNGLLYGVTNGGGAIACSNGCGTVYTINLATNAENVIYSFSGPADGAQPTAGLLAFGGLLYGTTSHGASGSALSDDGTLFAIDPTTNALTTLYAFTNFAAGTEPVGALSTDGTLLYGTTVGGGANEHGVVFSYNPASSTYAPIASFSGGSGPSNAQGNLLVNNSVLYGTSFRGGANFNKCGTGPTKGCGSVFSVNLATSAVTVLHSFAPKADGNLPAAGLVLQGGKLVGTTLEGGKAQAGVIFAVDPTTGAESLSYEFINAKTGAGPNSLLDVAGVLYGTTSGSGNTAATLRYGTIFAFTP